MFTQEQQNIINEIIFITRFRFNLVYAARLSQVKHRNQVNASGRRLLWPDQSMFYLAVKLNFTETAQRLSHLKCDLNEKDVNGFTALRWAIINGNLNCVKIILNCVKIILNNEKVSAELPEFLEHLISEFNVALQREHHHIAQYINYKIISLGGESLIAYSPPVPNVPNTSKFKSILLKLEEMIKHPQVKAIIEKFIEFEKLYIKAFPLKPDKAQKIIQAHIMKLLEELKQLSTPACAPQLFIGEADYSGAKAMIEKHSETHPTMAASVTATEYMSEAQAKNAYEKIEENVNQLRREGATVLFSIDARSLHQHPEFSGKRFPRIHFNCPHDRRPMHERTLPALIHDFFKSARVLQKDGDKIYIALPKLPKKNDNHFRLSYIYDIYNASAKAGYQYIKKRQFGSKRYPGYEHRITGKDESVQYTDFREHIFKKTNLTYEEIVKLAPSIKYYAYKENRDALPDINTDNDSSDYMEIEPNIRDYRPMQQDLPEVISAPQSPLHASSIPNVESAAPPQVQNKLSIRDFFAKKSSHSIFSSAPTAASQKENAAPNSKQVTLRYSLKPVSETNPASGIQMTHQFLAKLHGHSTVNPQLSMAHDVQNNPAAEDSDDMCVDSASTSVNLKH